MKFAGAATSERTRQLGLVVFCNRDEKIAPRFHWTCQQLLSSLIYLGARSSDVVPSEFVLSALTPQSTLTNRVQIAERDVAMTSHRSNASIVNCQLVTNCIDFSSITFDRD